ncbi:MAG: GH116 family glycosyl hydrolase [Sediminicola sp.]
MKNKDRNKDRRSFLKNLGALSLGTSIIPNGMFAGPSKQTYQGHASHPISHEQTDALNGTRKYNGTYTGKHLDRIAFPIGGMGAGMFCLEGSGSISHMSIGNRPQMFKSPNMFAAISVKGMEKGAKVLEGPVPQWKLFGPPKTGNGSFGANHGLPRFEHATFKTQFPFATIALEDKDLPLKINIKGWSPFIPTDEDNSGLPVGALEYTFKNAGKTSIEAVFSYNSWNFVKDWETKGGIRGIPNGFVLRQDATEKEPHLESHFAIFTNEEKTVVDHCWFRGNWFDPLTMVWNTIEKGQLLSNPPVEEGAPGASLFVPFTLEPGQERTIEVMMAWYTPESQVHNGELGSDKNCDNGNDCCSSSKFFGGGPDLQSTTYKPYYSNKFGNINDVVDYWRKHYEELLASSCLFRDSFYASTLPDEVMEAVAANLTILKSPTVMRQFDGRLWSWEGCGDEDGCCPGSCTHVWNYAQAIPHLFPVLERTLRQTEFCESQNTEGHQTFRANMPITPSQHDFHAAADGQLGGIMKVYREWRISGDDQWIKKIYPLVKTSMDFCIKTWDPQHKGVIEEPHHNTYDIEFWGPDGMCCSFYLGALLAMTEMGKFLKEDIDEYQRLYQKGKSYLENELFNGEYFIQNIKWTGLNAPDPLKESNISLCTAYSEEAIELLKKEGPKYQYGNGCLSDGILGGWIARMCAMEDPLDSDKIKSHLVAVHKYNLARDLTDHVNPQRPSYAVGNEGGLLLCSWPHGGKLSLPFVYSNEVWTGIEYQVASHLMFMGEVGKGLEIVRTCRDRYDGRIRNPFNEYECGSWYARAMASYGLIQGLTGIRYDAVDKTLFIDSKIGDDFTSFLSTATGFGNIGLKKGKPVIDIKYGKLDVQKIIVSGQDFKA